MCYTTKCATLQNVLHYKMCYTTKCATLQNVLHYKMCYTTKCATLQNVLHYKMCYTTKCATLQNVLHYKMCYISKFKRVMTRIKDNVVSIFRRCTYGFKFFILLLLTSKLSIRVWPHATRVNKLMLSSCSCLDEIGTSGESAAEFLTLYKKLIAPGHWKYYLALKGILGKIASLITKVRFFSYSSLIPICTQRFVGWS